ncbi:hypothetical protein [Aequorivita viscosa]|uniref:TonB protein C-terminal n=1 Tax=Aequorivita viscosa TaxID=797419 RepID=A0A1M6I7R5_9FLAO|nr:hypothetical protein [Aequorivita viscosa]SDW99459.1 hypothetical protein SAMN05216556_11422 [Aequorivita viscosa]SHJ30507.1 hypothetical protein SAMN04487908_11355 [Aequorivita viscosa]
MNWNNFLKVTIITFWVLLMVLGGLIGYINYIHYERIGKYPINTAKYPHDVGYINPKTAAFSEGFARCDTTLKPQGYYHSERNIFKDGKYQFRKTISKKYENNGYTDSGFLNLRFLVNCNGDVGNVEINELNSDYQQTDLNNELVDQLVNLSIAKENWTPKEIGGKTYDSYMYLIFKIENGEVLEILP